MSGVASGDLGYRPGDLVTWAFTPWGLDIAWSAGVRVWERHPDAPDTVGSVGEMGLTWGLEVGCPWRVPVVRGLTWMRGREFL